MAGERSPPACLIPCGKDAGPAQFPSGRAIGGQFVGDHALGAGPCRFQKSGQQMPLRPSCSGGSAGFRRGCSLHGRRHAIASVADHE